MSPSQVRFHSLICPQCGLTLTVSERAPARVTCPRCLASVEHSTSDASEDQPVPVLPLEKQVRSDRLANLASIVLLFLILVVGVALAGLGGRLGPVLLVAFAATLGLYFVFATERQRRQMKTRVVPSQQPRFISPPAVHVTNATSTLDYATPVPPAQEAGWRYFLFGFVYVVGIAVMVVGGAIPSFPLVAALIVVPALIAAFIPRARSFSVGVFIGVILCVVLPLGICFGIMAFK